MNTVRTTVGTYGALHTVLLTVVDLRYLLPGTISQQRYSTEHDVALPLTDDPEPSSPGPVGSSPNRVPPNPNVFLGGLLRVPAPLPIAIVVPSPFLPVTPSSSA